ncbi:MAG: electron transfer flavoprotein beta-subunit [Subtercola sp.]|jgi:electron transfer flavoprotein beta subunit|nr:electron transfer flavoprotein beta-subunit [Subtercola sp.]
MKIVVLLKQVPDTYEDRKLDLETGLLDRKASEPILEEITERALEVALQHKDSNKQTEIVLITMGPASVTSALRRGLSMGADRAVHVLDDALGGSDVSWTATALAAAIARESPDLVIAGNESTDGRGGVVPAMIAEHLRLPNLSNLHSVTLTESSVGGERGSESGSLTVHTSLPAVISVTERAAEARFPNFKGVLGAKKKPLAVLSLADLGISPSNTFAGAGRSVVISTIARPARQAGRKVTDDGNAAVLLADFLAEGRLI